MKTSKTQTVTIRIDSAIMAELRKAAKADKRSLNNMINLRLAQAAKGKP